MNITVTTTDWLAVAPTLTLTVWAILLMLVDVFFIPEREGSRKRTGLFAVIGLLATSILCIWLMGKGPIHGFNDMLLLDDFVLLVDGVILFVAAVAILMSFDYLPRQGIEQGEYYILLLFATVGCMLLAQSTNLIMIFMSLELLSIALYVLSGFAYPRLSSEEAGMKYLILGGLMAGCFVYGMALIYGATGSVDLQTIALTINHDFIAITPIGQTPIFSPLLLAGLGLIMVAFSFKVSLVPFHSWTPDVYEGAPTPITAFMSVATKASAFAALLHLLTIGFPMLESLWGPLLAALAALTIAIGTAGAFIQTTVKRILAYSSISHAGYLLMAIISAGTWGSTGFLIYLSVYALANMGAFGVITALERRATAGSPAELPPITLDTLSGLWGHAPGSRDPQRTPGSPILAIMMAVFIFSLAGVPPMAGFTGKLGVFLAAWQGGYGWLVGVGVVFSIAAVWFYLRIIVRMFMTEPVEALILPGEAIPNTNPPRLLLSRALQLGIYTCFIGSVVWGVLPTGLIDLIERSVLGIAGR